LAFPQSKYMRHRCHKRPKWPILQLSTKNLDEEYNDIEEFGIERDPLFQRRSTRWVIVVDDEEPIRKAVGQLLFDKGYQVTACADGRAALKVALSRRVDLGDGDEASFPDCIVSDIRMPGMDGLELLRCIRTNANLLEIPVVLLTAKGMTQDRIAGYDAGADAYLPKPFDPEELVVIVDNVIDRHVTLSGSDVQVDDLKRDLDEIKYLLLEKGGGGVGNGWVEQTNVFLAPDEREVLKLLCQGLTTKEIAEKAFLSTRRVEQLLTRMFRKTAVKNRTELVRWAMATGNVRL
jgi:DNA-binding NarL/FixJ family response regulator